MPRMMDGCSTRTVRRRELILYIYLVTLVGWGANHRVGVQLRIISEFFSEKMHEIENILVCRGGSCVCFYDSKDMGRIPIFTMIALNLIRP